MNPTDVRVDQTIRFEGDSNPDDEDIVFAIECGGCDCRGVYSAAYGPTTPPEDAAHPSACSRPASVGFVAAATRDAGCPCIHTMGAAPM